MSSYSLSSGYAWHCHKAAAELRRQHEVNQELLAALKVAALAIHEYRTQGAPHAYWDDVEYQAAEAIAKGEQT
jgi:hypothetical protein